MGTFAHTLIARTGCRVIATEPVEALRAKIAPSPRLIVLPFAVGDTCGPVLIDVTPHTCPHVVVQRPNKTATAERVHMLTLDRFLERAGATRIDLLKVDIEGAELGMFESSAGATLLAVKQIAVEFHDFIDTSARTRMRVADIKRLLRQLGFAQISFSRDNTDLLFLNRSLINVSALEVVRLTYVTRNFKGIQRAIHRFTSPR